MLNGTSWLKQILYPIFEDQKAEKSEDSLSQPEKELYDHIVASLKFFATPRLNHPVLSPDGGKEHEYSLTFYHTKSWKIISDRFLNDVESDDPLVNEWIANWKSRIDKFRNNQAAIRSTYIKIDKFKQNIFEKCIIESRLKSSEAALLKEKEASPKKKGRKKNKGFNQKEYARVTKEINNISKEIEIYKAKIDVYSKNIVKWKTETQEILNSGLEELKGISLPIYKSCHHVIVYMISNWMPLTEFSRNNLLTIDIDEEKIHSVPKVTIVNRDDESKEDSSESKPSINEATPAIFLFKQTITKSFVADTKGERYHLITPTQIEIKNKLLFQKSPIVCQEPKLLSKEMIYDMAFDYKCPEQQHPAKVLLESEKIALDIDRIVQMAVKKIDAELAKSK